MDLAPPGVVFWAVPPRLHVVGPLGGSEAGDRKAGHPWEVRLRLDTVLGESPVSPFLRGSCCCLIWAGRGGPGMSGLGLCPRGPRSGGGGGQTLGGTHS